MRKKKKDVKNNVIKANGDSPPDKNKIILRENSEPLQKSGRI